jgi:hypothetical protein
LNRATEAIGRYFFQPVGPERLGACRAAFYLWLFLFYLPLVETVHSEGLTDFADVSEVLWMPISFFEALGIEVLPRPWLDVAELLWKVSLLTSCIGLFTRVSMWVAFLLGAYVIGLPLNFGSVPHSSGVVVLTLGIMALSRAGDALSVDAWWRRHEGEPEPGASGEYRWPIRFAWVLLATIYCSSGVVKWLASGLDYLDPEIMGTYLTQRSYGWSTRPLTDLGLRIADVAWLCTGMAAWTLLAETGFFLALFSRRAAAILVPGMFLMHVAIAALLGPQFFQFLSVYVFWIPWGNRLRRPAPLRMAGGAWPSAEGDRIGRLVDEHGPTLGPGQPSSP